MTQSQDKMRAEIPAQMLQELFDAATDAGNLLFLPWRDVREMRNETAERINAAIAAIRSLPCDQQSAQSQQDALAPLTDEQIKSASLKAGMQEHYMGFHSGFIKFARAIEAEHGITAIATQGASNV